ncbi:hypothetical protein SAMN05428971_1503 [Candidatus Pantoea varia]|uniref:Uncharacterized protein n=1 Tax=Candidatus Pantoea varia TaxID=1881036 RepID=A0A1I4Z7C0_9GAMM|nr:hypothetical protein [Pantoea varia]SFN46088.1 hypothetical protein SAMN05428971_1503 [Pantoea varia]
MNRLIVKKYKENDGIQLIDLSVVGNDINHSLFLGKVDVNEFIGWFLKHEREIREDELPIEIIIYKSLAENVHYSYDTMDVDDDDLVDQMYNYRRGHCLRFASRGCDFPEIYIGKVRGLYEISKFSAAESWKYYIDIEEFFKGIKC